MSHYRNYSLEESGMTAPPSPLLSAVPPAFTPSPRLSVLRFDSSATLRAPLSPSASGASTPVNQHASTFSPFPSTKPGGMRKGRWSSAASSVSDLSSLASSRLATLTNLSLLLTGDEKYPRRADNDKISTHEKEEYQVLQVHHKDDVDRLPTWKHRLHKLTPLTTTASMGAFFVYFAFRIMYILDSQVQSNQIFALAWVFIAVEFGVAFPMLLHAMWQLFIIKGRRRAKLRLVGENVPTVDVFVTCCREDANLIMDTAVAALHNDYPADRFRVVILDDGGDKTLEGLVHAKQALYPNLFYNARVKIPGVPHHAKAGNLNAGLAFVDQLPGGGGEFMAALDADMIPEAHWLRAIIAHLVIDPKLALSCPPQLFYNVPKNDPLLQSLDGFIHVSETVKDAAGVAWCTGSGYATRRSALDAIGQFPIGSLAEDVCFSSMLLGAGWKTAYIHEPLQWGTVPDTFTGHIKQRTRWTIGTLQTAWKLRFCIAGPLVRNMTFFQRLSGFVYTVSSLFTIFLSISIWTMPVVLVAHGRLVAYATNDQLRWLIRLVFISLMTARINEYVMFIPAGYRVGQREAAAMLWTAPFFALTVIRSFILPSWLGGTAMAFSSSGSLVSDINERDAQRRAPLLTRLRVILIDYKVIIHLFYVIFCVVAVILSTVWVVRENVGASQTLLGMLVHAGWPPMLWLQCLVACFTPIHYAIWPPSMPDREELLDRDSVTGVARPKQEFRKLRWGKESLLMELQYTSLTIYTIVLFVGSFLY